MTFLAFVVPLPYYIEVPGGSGRYHAVLKVNDTEDKEAGIINSLMLSPACYFSPYDLCLVDPFTDIRSAQETTGGSSDIEFMRINHSTCKHHKTWPSIRD